ncbi:MAG: Clp protease ClpS [Ignavibacteriales bacterium CG_4_9_14_3_um_filter_30_11]|nr:MAG: Clp protease ClpS [Ignavibacteriales bacterium CG_4_9_14_3_um_filter_30_11]
MEKLEQFKPVIDVEIGESTDSKLLSRVIVYNDDWHTFDEVIIQLIKATNCMFEKARSQAFEIHTKGSCIVYKGKMSSCIKVSSILEEIALLTQIIL